MSRYNPEAVVCVGIPFGHTRPQWIFPHGGTITVDGTEIVVPVGRASTANITTTRDSYRT